MKTSTKGLQLIKHFEGCKLQAYICPAGVATIGWGTTIYPDGKLVRMGDVCTEEQAHEYLVNDVSFIEKKLERDIAPIVNQNQFDAIVSFCYNLGTGAFNSSTLKKRILINTRDETNINSEWMKWVYVNKVKNNGLIRRRKSEYHLYSTGELNYFNN